MKENIEKTVTEDVSRETQDSMNSFVQNLRDNPNNFSFWFPRVKASEALPFSLPESVIIPVPKKVMFSFFMEKYGDEERVRAFIRNTVLPAIPESFGKRVFLKNGCFSDKFNFKVCTPEANEDSLYRSILELNMDSFAFDTGGNTELVIRKLVGQNDDIYTETIYNGMPLRPEIRLFYDFDRKKTLYAVNYWDWDYCHDAICRDGHDAEVYEKNYRTINNVVNMLKSPVLKLADRRFGDIDLSGIWSVDLMLAEDKWWLIDMALGHMSAYWNPEKIKSL